QRLNQQIKQQRAELTKLRGTGSKFIAQLRNMALAYIGIQAAMRFIQNTVKTIINFQKAQSSLLAISGKTRKELEKLTAQSKSLGATTEFTATQVTGLQIELAKLGFTINEISLSTEAILNFASATGSDLSAAAKTAGIALRVFGLDATKMQDVVSTLAVATTKSALTFEDFDTILSNAGPVFKAYGFGLQEMIALSGKLADAGFDASKGSTAMRNIMLNLADVSGPLSRALGRNVNNLDDLVAGMIELRKSGVDLNETLQITDKRSVAAFNTFLQSAESALELRDGISGVNDELQIMVDKKLDNLAGDITKLSSAWEGFILKGEGGVNAFRYIIQFLNDLVIELGNLDLIFTRSSKLTKEQVSRSFDVLMALTNKQGKAFRDLIEFSDKIVYESVKTQGKGFEEQLEKAGFTAEESTLLWDEYLKRREEQYEAEVKAAKEAADKKVEIEESAITKLEREKLANAKKVNDKMLKIIESQNEEEIDIEDKEFDRKFRLANIQAERLYDIEKEWNEATEKERIAIFEREKENLEEKIKLYAGLGSQLGTIMGDFIADSEISFKEFSKNMLITALDFLEKKILMARVDATVASLTTMDSILTFGASGLARAAIINGLISAAFAGVKMSISKFHEGEIDIQGRGDEFPAILKKGESVIKPESTSKHKSLLSAVNMGLSDAEVFNAMLSDMNRPLQVNEFRDDRLLRQMELNNKHTKRLIEIQEDRPEINYLPGKGFVISHKNKTTILKRG
ncbi:MAG TPA: phage tail tape measure protein, partial [Ignavibacteriaceae bacterium]|nr:phage tail tape measure protein [Ignavibacteriaceae bacterium]